MGSISTISINSVVSLLFTIHLTSTCLSMLLVVSSFILVIWIKVHKCTKMYKKNVSKITSLCVKHSPSRELPHCWKFTFVEAHITAVSIISIISSCNSRQFCHKPVSRSPYNCKTSSQQSLADHLPRSPSVP